MLVERLGHWNNIQTTLIQRLVSTRKGPSNLFTLVHYIDI